MSIFFYHLLYLHVKKKDEKYDWPKLHVVFFILIQF